MQESEILRNRRSTQPCGLDEIRPRGVGGWVDYYQKNKPQTNALAAGIMVVLYGGQQMAWGIFNNHLKAQPWAGGYEDEGTVFWAITSWFIAVIVGLFAASIAVNKWSKLSIYVSRGCLIVEAFLKNFNFSSSRQSFRRSARHCSSRIPTTFITFSLPASSAGCRTASSTRP